MNPFTSAVAEVKLTTFLDGIRTERAKNHFKTFMRSEMCDFDYIHVFMVDTASNTQADASMH